MIAMTLAGLELNSGTPDADGALWYATKWEGWDSPPMRQETMDPSLQDGTIVADSKYGPRSVYISGVCKASGEAGYWTARSALMTLIAPHERVDLVVSETVDKRLGVKRTGNWKISELPGSAFEWTVELLAEDPRKYAVTPTVVVIGAGGSSVVTNNGSTPTFPVITTSGTLLLTHVGSGQYIAGTALSSGTEIDMRKRTVYAGSTNQFHKISSLSAWWSLLKGANTISNGGSASATITYHDAWI